MRGWGTAPRTCAAQATLRLVESEHPRACCPFNSTRTLGVEGRAWECVPLVSRQQRHDDLMQRLSSRAVAWSGCLNVGTPPRRCLPSRSARWGDSRARARRIALVYHRVAVRVATRAREILRRLWRIVAVGSCATGSPLPGRPWQRAARCRARAAPRQRFPAAITFDDDQPGTCATRSPPPGAALSATFFLGVGRRSAAPHTFWWEDLQRAVDGKLIEANAMPHVAETDVRADSPASPKAIFASRHDREARAPQRARDGCGPACC